MTSIAHAVPKTALTNKDLESKINTTDDWITERTGIKQRYIAEPGRTTLSLAMESVQKTLAHCSKDDIAQIDAIICGTSSPDYYFPTLSCEIARELNLDCMAFDLQAACSGFVYATDVARTYVESGQKKKILVVGVEIISKVLDWTNRKTSVLFGDGAGSCLLELSHQQFFLANMMKTVVDPEKILHLKNSILDPSASGHIEMDGPKVFKAAVNTMSEIALKLLKKANLSIEDIDLFIPHQANQRIIEAVGERVSCPTHKVFSCVASYGNTSSASIPIAISEALKDLKKGQSKKIMTISFGGGLTSGGFIFDYLRA
jgi:3-oxoacyl-[acyl-carrier-protein] synthase-3